MSNAALVDAIRQELLPKVCRIHRKEVWHDERECPCCRIVREVFIGRRAEMRLFVETEFK